MSDKLKPCPFCGKSDKIVSGEVNGAREHLEFWATGCERCEAYGPNSYLSIKDADAKWNTRPEPAKHGELVDKMGELVKHWEDEQEFGAVIVCIADIGILKQAIQALSGGGWISVEDDLPKTGQHVLGWFPELGGRYNYPVITYFEGEEWKKVTHWMSLPKPPTEKGD